MTVSAGAAQPYPEQNGGTSWQGSLREALQRARQRGRPVIITREERLPDPPDLLALYARAEADGEPRFLATRPAEAYGLLALGSEAELLSNDADPIAEVRRWAAGLACEIEPRARFFGGFAFAPRPAEQRDPLWRSFANARFTLPARVYERRGSSGTLTRIAYVRPDDDGSALLRHGEPQIERSAPTGARFAVTRLRGPDCDPPATAFEQPAREVIAAIQRGEARKVVLTCRETWLVDGPVPVASILERLCATHPACLTFAEARADQTFLGATPERLVHRRGSRVRASALAGTVATGRTEAERRRLAAALLSSSKERREHALVVEAIEHSLAGLAARLHVPADPDLLDTGTVQHLHTLIHADLEHPVHVLELIARLHPTPAVGGVPLERAQELIAKHERFDRGAYAGPIGWFDPTGDGDFALALRCGLFGPERLQLFAGAGLVAGSDPAREAEETQLKLAALRGALEAVCSA